MKEADTEGGGRHPGPVARFGARVGGVALALPAGTALEFVVAAPIHPLPLAPARVAGLMQLRGQPVVVLDPLRRGDEQGGVCRHDVLVVGAPPLAALVVDGPPQPLPERVRLAPRAPAGCAFAAALDAACSGRREADAAAGPGGASGDEAWLEVEPVRMFEALVRA